MAKKKAASKSAATKSLSRAPARKKKSGATGSSVSVDTQLVKLLAKRVQATVSEFERSGDVRSAMFDPAAEEELFRQLQSKAGASLPPAMLEAIWREILSAARAKVEPVRAAYLGPAFSFTHLAAIEHFGRSADLVPVDSITGIFEEVNRGHVQYGVVPIENSTDGRIVDTLEMFTRLPLSICGEVNLAIHHNLLSRSPRSEIVEVYSKPQALSQCRNWLASNLPSAALRAVTSTSTAAQLARDKAGAAAVASDQAAVQYGLEVVANNIQDVADNATRFAVIGNQTPKPTKLDRTSILLQIPHKPGKLADALACFDKHRINLSWIESFPLRSADGEKEGYQFFLDAEGHRDEAKMKRALADLGRVANKLEVLGSYPRCEKVV